MHNTPRFLRAENSTIPHRHCTIELHEFTHPTGNKTYTVQINGVQPITKYVYRADTTNSVDAAKSAIQEARNWELLLGWEIIRTASSIRPIQPIHQI